MKQINFIYVFLMSVCLGHCNWLKTVDEEYYKMLITSSHLKLYSNNTFSDETASDIIMQDGNSYPVISTGIYERIKDGLILKYEKSNLIDTLFYINWGNKKFLLDEYSVIDMCNGINLGTIDYSIYNGLSMYWTNVESKNMNIEGIPKLPLQFSNYIFRDTLSANIIYIDEKSLKIKINKGKRNNLLNGCELTDGTLSFIVNELYTDFSILIPKDLYSDLYLHSKYGDEYFPIKPFEKYIAGIKGLKKGETLVAKK